MLYHSHQVMGKSANVCVEWEETKKLFGDNRRQRGGEEMADGNQTAVGDSSLGELTLTGSA